MSRRGEKRDNARLGRARDELDKGLSRRDVDRVLDALLALPSDARDEALGPVFALLKNAVRAAHTARAWGRLVFFAARIELEPRLLLVEPEAAVEIRWSLLWGSAMSGQWERATRFRIQLEEGAAPIPEAKARALKAWLDAKGMPDPEAWRSVGLPEPPAPDPRLGFEPVTTRKNRIHSLPQRVCDADGALVALRAGEDWGIFAATVERWLKQVPADVADAIRATASELAMREALAGLGASSAPIPSEQCRPTNPYEPLSLFALCARKGGEGRLETSLLAFRLCLQSLTADPGRRPSAQTLSQIVRLVMSDPAARPILAESLEGIARDGTLGDYLLPALEAAHHASPSPRLWALGARAATLGLLKKLRGGGAHSERAVAPPAWLEKTLPDQLGAGEPMAAWLGQDARAARDVVEFVANAMPVDRAAAWILATWPHADEATHGILAGGVDSLLERLSSKWCEECCTAHPGDFDSYKELSPAGQRVWERLEPVVFLHASRFLDMALGRAREPADRRELLVAYAGTGRSLERCLEATRAASEHQLVRVAATLRQRVVSRFSGDAASLARGVLWCIAHDPTPKMCVALSRALLESGTAGTASASPMVEKAMHVAKRMANRGRKRGDQASKSRAGEQVDLFGGA